MTTEERDKLKRSIEEAKEVLSKDLLTPEDASQLWRMIDYYQDKINKEEQSDGTI